MGKVYLITLIGFTASVLLAVNGFDSQLLHGLIGAYMGFLIAPIFFGKKDE